MKILLTGAAGFIGMHAALRLLQRGDEVAWPGYDSAPGCWNGRWNPSTSTGAHTTCATSGPASVGTST